MFGMLGMLGSIPWPLAALIVIVMIAMAAHVVRTHQNTYWLWVIIAFPGIGALIYFCAVILPEWSGGASARRMGRAALDAIDPGHAYRQAKAAYDDVPTVQNTMKLAEAAAGMARWAEAESLYATAAQGHYADDPALLLGRAQALVELDRPAEALESLDRLQAQGGRPPQADLLRARALHALGRMSEAEKWYQTAVERLPGLEAMARQAAFLAETGRPDQAREILTEIERRTRKTQAHFRTEARRWRDFAAAKLG
jgi:hypothetical protein